MKFKTIRAKLIKAVSLVLIFSFALVLSIVAYLDTTQSESNLVKHEASIRNSLIAKGQTLVNNNSQALQGMVEDNAFSAVQELVSKTVLDDQDIVYGIFMDPELMPWVEANTTNPNGEIVPGKELVDEVSLWASELIKQSHMIFSSDLGELYEFAAPVVVNDEILGSIRYGFSTLSVKEQLIIAREDSRHALRETITILIATILLAIIAGVISSRVFATKLTIPLNKLTEAADTIAKGNYENEINVVTNDEIGSLANNFEKMRATIKKKMSDLALLNQTGESLAASHDQRDALRQVFNVLQQQIGIEVGRVFLNSKDKSLRFFCLFNKDSLADRYDFELHDQVIKDIAIKKEILTLNNPELWQKGPFTNYNFRFVIPLLDKGILLGVMDLAGYLDRVEYEDGIEEFVSSLIRTLAISLTNINMLEVIEEQNRTLEEKVEERTTELAQKTNDISSMMSNMHQGLFTIMESGKIHHEYSKYLETIFETDKIADQHFMHILFTNSDIGSNSLDQVKTAVDAIIGFDDYMFDFNAHLLISEYKLIICEGSSKFIELDWDPIVFEGQVEKLMVTVRDVTDIRSLAIAAEQQKQELAIIGQILSIGEEKIYKFIQTSEEFISKCRFLIKTNHQKDIDVINSLFRNMHTIKGNARTYGFNFITDSVHDVEASYDELRKDETKQWNPELLLTELHSAELDIQRYQNIASTKLGYKLTSANLKDECGKSKKLLDEINHLFQSDLPQCIKSVLSESYQMLLSTEAKPLSDVVSSVVESLPSLARKLGKPEPIVEIDNGGVFIESQANELLENIFTHVLTNALDHGLESESERVNNDKKSNGRIDVNVIKMDGSINIEIFDDGRGLALKKIFMKAVEKGIYEPGNIPPDTEVANLIFSSGFSTADKVTSVSGRGVGMDAVRKFLKESKGDITIELSDDKEDEAFRPFKTVINLPSNFYRLAPEWMF